MDVGVIEKHNGQFFMVGKIIDHRNDIKSSKLAASLRLVVPLEF